MGILSEDIGRMKSLDGQIKVIEASLRRQITDMMEREVLPEVRRVVPSDYQLRGYKIIMGGNYGACIDLKIPQKEVSDDQVYAPKDLTESWNAALRGLFNAKEEEYGVMIHGFHTHPRA